MAKYSTGEDVTEEMFKNMGEDYHAQAEDYINSTLILPSGYAPSEITSTVAAFTVLKRISINYAKYLFCRDSSKNQDDVWAAVRMPSFEREFRDAVRNFDSQLLAHTSESDANYREPGGMNVRLHRG